jgi:hypothetical protein
MASFLGMQRLLHRHQNRHTFMQMWRLRHLLNLIKGKDRCVKLFSSPDWQSAPARAVRVGEIQHGNVGPTPPPTSGERQDGQAIRLTAMTVAFELLRGLLSLA